MDQHPDDIFTVPRLEQIPYLIHGFGTGRWRELDIKAKLKGKDFRLLFLNQIHSNIVHFIDKIPSDNLDGDALITRLDRLLMVIKTADCLPVLMVEKSRKIIAAVHCGWRGTQKKVIQRVLEGIEDHYNGQLGSLLVALGPSIGPECYEVGQDVRQEFKEADLPLEVFRPHPVKDGKYFLDLKEANLLQLLNLGVKRENIFTIDSCTQCSSFLPSFRRDGKKAGRMLSFIGMSF
jgi:YfiH family protein